MNRALTFAHSSGELESVFKPISPDILKSVMGLILASCAGTMLLHSWGSGLLGLVVMGELGNVAVEGSGDEPTK